MRRTSSSRASMKRVPGGGDDVLLDHRRAHVVGAERERDLADLAALRDPARLDVARRCRGRGATTASVRRYSQPLAADMCRRACSSSSASSVLPGWKLHGMNARKPTCPAATASSCTSRTRAQVLDALLERLERRRTSSSRWSRCRACAPRASRRATASLVAFLGRDVAAHAVDEDLGAAAGQRVEAGVAQAPEHLGGGDAGDAARCARSRAGRSRARGSGMRP